jgi:hypothetical protein
MKTFQMTAFFSLFTFIFAVLAAWTGVSAFIYWAVVAGTVAAFCLWMEASFAIEADMRRRQRISILLDKITDEIINQTETGWEAYNENDFDGADECSYRIENLEMRYERVKGMV